MALQARQEITYWAAAAAVFLLLLWWMGDVILPFLLGAGVAYLLDPVADALQRLGLGRVLSVAIITIAALILFATVALLVIPTLVQQSAALIGAAPELAQSFEAFLAERFPNLADADSTLRRSLLQLGETVQARGAQILETVLSSVGGLVGTLFLFVIVPVVAFYLLLDWDQMVAQIDALLPRDHAPVIRDLARQIDRTLASFVRGQGLVCLIVGTYYAVALALVGLQFGLVVGAIAGFLTFIPYVGAIVGGGLAIGLALFQFWGEWWWILAVYVIFQSGQMVEGNVLTPKLVGSSVGLHPVWLLLALAVFGALFGFVGLLVAVPIAAVIGVLARFATARYRESALYRGAAMRPDLPPRYLPEHATGDADAAQKRAPRDAAE